MPAGNRRQDTTTGELVEFDLGGEFGYAVATAYHKKYGHVLHVLSGTHRVQAVTGDFLMGAGVAAVVFFPLNAARRRKIVRVVGRTALRGKITWQPIFRTQLNMPLGDQWSLWDGHVQRRVGKLTVAEMQQYPLLQLVSDGYVVHLLKTGVHAHDEWPFRA